MQSQSDDRDAGCVRLLVGLCPGLKGLGLATHSDS